MHFKILANVRTVEKLLDMSDQFGVVYGRLGTIACFAALRFGSGRPAAEAGPRFRFVSRLADKKSQTPKVSGLRRIAGFSIHCVEGCIAVPCDDVLGILDGAA